MLPFLAWSSDVSWHGPVSTIGIIAAVIGWQMAKKSYAENLEVPVGKSRPIVPKRSAPSKRLPSSSLTRPSTKATQSSTLESFPKKTKETVSASPEPVARNVDDTKNSRDADPSMVEASIPRSSKANPRRAKGIFQTIAAAVLIILGTWSIATGYRIEAKIQALQIVEKNFGEAQDEYFESLQRRPDPLMYNENIPQSYLDYKTGMTTFIDTLQATLREVRNRGTNLEIRFVSQKKFAYWILGGFLQLLGFSLAFLNVRIQVQRRAL
jgi:hypothetical protein